MVSTFHQAWEVDLIISNTSICNRLTRYSETSLVEKILSQISLMTMMISLVTVVSEWVEDLEAYIPKCMVEAAIIDKDNRKDRCKIEIHSADLV